MTTRSRSLARLLCAGLLLFIPGLVLAGANAGGTLILHASPSLVYTDGNATYCGQAALDSCSAAVTSVAWDPDHTVVFHVIAAFPPESQPRMKGVSFGVDYDPEKFVLTAHGTCADMEIPDGGWPQPGTGTGQTWTYTTQTALLTEVYWFAGHTYSEVNPDSTSFALIPRPLDGGIFVDDAAPRMADSVAAYGRLGFGAAGYLACPAGGGDSTGEPDLPGSGGDDPPGGGGDNPGTPGDHEFGVALAKIEKASLSFPTGVTSVTMAGAMQRGGVVLSDTLAHVLRTQGVVAIDLCVPNFNPAIVDRYGKPVLGADDRPLEVPEDLSLWFRLTLDNDGVKDAVARLASTPGVLTSELNFTRQALTPPNDSYFDPEQWGLYNHGQYCGAPDLDINFLPAWETYGQGRLPVRVGVIDTGIDPGHPDLPSQEQGPNLVSPGNPPIDDDTGVWHGTACAGIIGMRANNNRGGAGVASGATIVAVKALDSQGSGYAADMATALDWLRSAGVKVVSMSYGSSSPSSIERESLRNARAAGMANVAAMGNDDSESPSYPAAYAKHALAVGACTNVGERWRDVDLPGGAGWTYGSNWGSHIDLIAPGGRGIMTTKNHLDGNGYYDLSPMDPDNCQSNNWISCNGFGGTSAATPVVAGVLGSLLAYNGQIDGEDAQQICIRTAHDLDWYGLGWDSQSGWGLPDLFAALERVTVPNRVERGTAAGGSVQNDGSGDFILNGVPGFGNGNYGFHRKKVTHTVNLSQSFVGTPSAWPRVQGSIGWPYIPDGETYYYTSEDAGYAEVASATATTVTVQTWFYDIYTLGGAYVGTFPNNGNVAMSYTLIGYDPTTGVEDGGAQASSVLRVWPNPAEQRASILARPFGGRPNVRIDLYSAAGRIVRSLTPSVDGRAEWDLRDDHGHRVAAGTYFVRVPGDGTHRYTKLLVVR